MQLTPLIHKEAKLVNFSTGSFQKGKTTILPVFIDQNVEQLGLQLKPYHGERKDHVVWFDHESTRFVVVGLGAKSKFNLNKFRDAAAFGARAAVKKACRKSPCCCQLAPLSPKKNWYTLR
jgi:hypothetical protein